jgi:class 3 adenylate cyclase
LSGLPTGKVTFLFTDVEGSTRLIEQHPDAMGAALARHHVLLERAVADRGGHVFNVVGDAICSAFDDAAKAIDAALAGQRALQRESFGPIASLRVRMGLHTGAVEVRDGEYAASLALVRVQRVTSAGHGGQVLLSAATADAVSARLPAGTTLRSVGAYKLRGLAEPELLYQLVAADLPSDFPALRVEETAPSSASPLDRLVRGQLVGRNAELVQLERCWSEAQQARGQLVLLSGEPGVGKTRLANALMAHAQRRGATVLRGGCYEYEATTPYLPLVEAFREWVHGQSDAELRAALGAAAPEIAKFAPEIEARLGAFPPGTALSPNDERLRLFDHAARFIEALAAERGLLVFIDDVHWADQGTLSLLHYLLRHLRHARVLFVAAYREIELDRTHPLASALVDWNRERLAMRIALGRLSREATGALLAALFGQARVSDEFIDAMYAETEGNPFFVEEVVKSLVEQGEIYREGERWERKETHELAIPQSVKEAIGRRLNRLTEAAVDALRTAAALGKVFLFGELAAVVSTGDDVLLDALDEASGAQLIRSNAGVAGDDSFAFTHDKIREVLYEELNPIRRRRLHQRIGETLEGLYATSMGRGDASSKRGDVRAQDLAYHFTLSGDLEKSLAYSLAAARDAQRIFANDEALKFLEQAREAAEGLGRAADVAAIDERIGDIHEARGNIRPAVDAYERALAATAQREARAALKAKVGAAYAPIGDARGLASLEEALAELDPRTQTNELALATALVARYYHYRAEHAKAIEFLNRARELAEPLDDAKTLTDIYTYLAGAHQHVLQYEESCRFARAAIALGERKGHPLAIALGNEFLGENAAGRGFWDDALAYSAKNAEHGRKVGSFARLAWSAFCRAQALQAKGDLTSALSAALEAIALSSQIGEERLATWLDPLTATIAADLGDDDAARMHADRGYERAQQLNQLVLSAWALDGLGYAARLRGDVEAAADAYGRYVTLVSDTENAVARNLALAHAAEAMIAAGRLDEASALIDQALAIAQFAGAPHRYALALAAKGRLFAARSRHDDALAAFDEAIALYAQCDSRVERARTVCARAEVRLLHGDDAQRAKALADVREARDWFALIGASHDRGKADAVLS